MVALDELDALDELHDHFIALGDDFHLQLIVTLEDYVEAPSQQQPSYISRSHHLKYKCSKIMFHPLRSQKRGPTFFQPMSVVRGISSRVRLGSWSNGPKYIRETSTRS